MSTGTAKSRGHCGLRTMKILKRIEGEYHSSIHQHFHNDVLQKVAAQTSKRATENTRNAVTFASQDTTSTLSSGGNIYVYIHTIRTASLQHEKRSKPRSPNSRLTTVLIVKKRKQRKKARTIATAVYDVHSRQPERGRCFRIRRGSFGIRRTTRTQGICNALTTVGSSIQRADATPATKTWNI